MNEYDRGVDTFSPEGRLFKSNTPLKLSRSCSLYVRC
ncbi:hypothetical protein AALP_AA2G198600 [Arabis alpina]|uniref:Uncharacterized protein n=1 Tax=Arabis alpina TaxID=50452 RepID=A0A087HIP2_ARAAL|nr:hypothetical protein AALP_AA2G198600 [Arabis alpina]